MKLLAILAIMMACASGRAARADGLGEASSSSSTIQLKHPADGYISALPLGAFMQARSTTFRVFAPTAQAVEVRVFRQPKGGEARILPMERNPDGTWEVLV